MPKSYDMPAILTVSPSPLPNHILSASHGGEFTLTVCSHDGTAACGAGAAVTFQFAGDDGGGQSNSSITGNVTGGRRCVSNAMCALRSSFHFHDGSCRTYIGSP